MDFKKRRFPNLIIEKNSITGTYKGREFSINLIKKNNAFYKPGENRYDIDVYEPILGMYDVSTYQDFENITEALKYALEGALL